jgi:hypothetical protein
MAAGKSLPVKHQLTMPKEHVPDTWQRGTCGPWLTTPPPPVSILAEDRMTGAAKVRPSRRHGKRRMREMTKRQNEANGKTPMISASASVHLLTSS